MDTATAKVAYGPWLAMQTGVKGVEFRTSALIFTDHMTQETRDAIRQQLVGVAVEFMVIGTVKAE